MALGAAQATTWRVRPLQEMFGTAVHVVNVEVESASLLRRDGEGCAVVYRAKVLKRFKGSYQSGQIVSFGPTIGPQVGQQYLVFLESSGGSWTSAFGEPAECTGEVPELIFRHGSLFKAEGLHYIRDVSAYAQRGLDYPAYRVTSIAVFEKRLNRLGRRAESR